MYLIEELRKLTELSRDSTKESIAKQVRKIIEEGGEVNYQITHLLVKEKMERGYTKKYSLAELQEKLPWKKSRLIEKLQKIVIVGVLKHEKRRYQLNKENELVKRIWNYYNEPGNKEKEKSIEIWKLIQRKKEKEKEIDVKNNKEKTKYREITKKEKEEYIQKIRDILEDVMDPLEYIKKFFEKNLVKALGYKIITLHKNKLDTT